MSSNELTPDRARRTEVSHMIAGQMAMAGIPVVPEQVAVFRAWVQDGPAVMVTNDQLDTLVRERHRAEQVAADPSRGERTGAYTAHTWTNDEGDPIASTSLPEDAECPHPTGRCRECRTTTVSPGRPPLRHVDSECHEVWCKDLSHYMPFQLPVFPETPVPPAAGSYTVGEDVRVTFDDHGATMTATAHPGWSDPEAFAATPTAQAMAASAEYERATDEARHRSTGASDIIAKLAADQFTAAAEQQERVLWRQRAQLGDEAFAFRNHIDIARLPDWDRCPPELATELAAVREAVGHE